MLVMPNTSSAVSTANVQNSVFVFEHLIGFDECNTPGIIIATEKSLRIGPSRAFQTVVYIAQNRGRIIGQLLCSITT